MQLNDFVEKLQIARQKKIVKRCVRKPSMRAMLVPTLIVNMGLTVNVIACLFENVRIERMWKVCLQSDPDTRLRALEKESRAVRVPVRKTIHFGISLTRTSQSRSEPDEESESESEPANSTRPEKCVVL